MKYAEMPWGMWALFSGSFCRQFTDNFGLDKGTANVVKSAAKPE